MSQEQVNKQKQTDIEEDVQVEVSDQTQELIDETDDLLDAIDEVLETNAEEFVMAFVQKGGE